MRQNETKHMKPFNKMGLNVLISNLVLLAWTLSLVDMMQGGLAHGGRICFLIKSASLCWHKHCAA